MKGKDAEPLDVAIVGIACRFTGARDVFAFWKNVLAAGDCAGETPPTRRESSEGFDPNSKGDDRVSRLVLDTTRAALDDAGMFEGVPKDCRVESFLGQDSNFQRDDVTRLDHGRVIAQTLEILGALHPEWSDEDLDEVREELTWTRATAGPGASALVGAACASAIVALDLGARALRAGTADLSIVGGVDSRRDGDVPRAVSPPGSRSADGAPPGDGVGVLVLKRLEDAERDGDRVYAVLKGLGLAGDPGASGHAAPAARAQATAMRRAYRRSGIDPGTVDLVEGQGLGVPASDRAELRALRAVFPRPDRGHRTLGAVSGRVGRATPLVGLAGLITAALALHHRVVPPTPRGDDPRPLPADAEGPFARNPKARPWIHGDSLSPRRAAVNAFGFAGLSAHAVLEEHAATADGLTPGCMPEWDAEAILLGAPDRPRWIELARALLFWLDSGTNRLVPLKDLAFTLNTGQGPFPVRVGLVVGSVGELRDRLRGLIERLKDPNCRSVRDANGTYFWEEPLAGPGRLAFLYPGEGSQYPGMLADLCPHFPELRAVLDTADRISRDRGNDHLPSEQLFGAPEGGGAGLWEIETAVNVVLSSQWALHQVLTRLGLRPDSVVGHSSGEFLALAAAGVIDADRQLEDRLGELGSVFDGLEKAGLVPSATLVAAATDRPRVEAACREAGDAVVVAVDNCPHQVIIAGPPESVATVVGRLRGQGVVCEELPFRRAYHTARFAEASAPVAAFFRGLNLRGPAVPLYSCTTGRRMGSEVETIRRLAIEQWTAPVAFRSTIEAMHDDGVRLFVEVGARGSLTGFVEDTLRGRPHFAVAANLPRRAGLTQLNHLVASLYAQGVSLDPGLSYARRRPRRIDLAADFQPPPTGPTPAVGLPKLRPSEGLIERLRAKTKAPSVSARNDDPHRNGSPNEATTADRFPPSLSNGPRKSSRNGQAPAHARSGDVTHDTGSGSPPREASEGMLVSYFQTMDTFLETQRDVVAAYLATRQRRARPPVVETEVSLNPAELGPVAPTRASEPSAPISVSPITDPAPPGPEARDDGCDLRHVLLEQVKRRTGYPHEMMDLDYDMEADLGIDSIKRVEIFGELQARGLVADHSGMEDLAGCRTLRQVLEVLDRHDPGLPARDGGPSGWVGEVEHFVPGLELVAIRWLDARVDPIASQHTLGGRRLSAIEPTRLGLPVLPFTVMAELLAQAASGLLPGQVVTGLREVQANRWVPYEADPVALEVRALRDPRRPGEVRVTIKNRGPEAGRGGGGDDPVFEGVVVFGTARGPGPPEAEFSLANAGPCRFSAEDLYGDQWLFHGPALQALERVGASSPAGIEGTLRVLPRRDLFPERLWPVLHTDPVVLDAFTHLLGCWGIDKQAGEEGDVMFPLRVDQIDLFGDDPPEGATVECRIRVREVARFRVKVDAELVAPGGRVWVAISGWEDWRFYWPGRYRDVCRQPDRVLLGEPLGLAGREGDGALSAVWLEPPADMGKPVWRDVLEWGQLGPDERTANRARGDAEPDRTLRVWGRIAAKDAARRLWLARGGAPVYPADLVIEHDPDGRPTLRSLLEPRRTDLPSVATAHADGVAVAIASLDPLARLGIAVVPVRPGVRDFPYSTLPESERLWLGQNTEQGAEREEWDARFRCAREAGARASGLEPASIRVVDGRLHTGEVLLNLGNDSGPAPEAPPARCVTTRRGEHVWAWLVLERLGS